ncbi:MAG: hypothetical protein IH607_00445 [Firmicutes bacterium]|nr:hypothetical protein [Bacillota bacterium]
MLKIESNLKINGRHWGLAFVDGVAYTANVALAAKLLLKGYVVTDWPEARDIVSGSEISPTHAPFKQGEYAQLERQPEAEHTVAGAINIKQESSPTPSSPAQDNTSETVTQLERPVSNPSNIVSTSDGFVSKSTVEVTKPKSTTPRKKAVTADAADKR